MKTLIESLRTNLHDYEQSVEITKGYDFSMVDVIRRIELYRASKFESGDWDSQNNRKYFFNIINPQCGNATKNIDLDRKNIRVRAERAKDRIKAMLYNDELKNWMKKESFGQVLNKISENLPIYGSVVLKKVGKMVMFRPLRYLCFDPAVSNSPNNFNIQSPYMIDKHNFTASEIEGMVKKGWDKEEAKRLVDKMRDMDLSEITVYEQYVEVSNEELDIAGDGYSMSQSYIAFLADKKKKDKSTEAAFFTLYKRKVDEMPYKKIDFLTIEGRALGLGVSEMLFPLQERRNEMGNQKADSMRLSSKTVFQTRDKNIEGNLLTETVNGDILKVNSELTRVDVAERNLGAFQQEEANIKQDTRDNANAQEILTGETMPSRTPFRLAVMQQENASKLFDFIRENLGMFLEEVLNEWVLTEFEKDTNKEHIFELYSRDTIKAVMKDHNNYRINEAIKKYVISSGKFPTEEELVVLEEQLNGNISDSTFVKVVQDYYKNFEKNLDIDITGEKHDSAQQVETLNNLIMLIAQNPAVVSDPTIQPLLDQVLELTGIAPSVFNTQRAAVSPTIAQQATGVGTPNAGSAPIAQQ